MATTISLYANGAEVTKLAAARRLAHHADGTVVTVYELEEGTTTIVERIDVFPRRNSFGEIQGARVNWGGIGSQGAAKARRYAEMLTLAAELIDLADMIAAETAAATA